MVVKREEVHFVKKIEKLKIGKNLKFHVEKKNVKLINQILQNKTPILR